MSAVLATAMLGCASSPDVADCEGSFKIDEGLTAWQREQVATAASRFNVWVGREVVAAGAAGRCEIRPEPATAEVLAVSPNPAAWYEPKTGIVGVDVARVSDACGAGPGVDGAPRCWQAMLMHEFGHSTGMQHTPADVVAIMAPGDLPDDFTPADRAECLARGPCRVTATSAR